MSTVLRRFADLPTDRNASGRSFGAEERGYLEEVLTAGSLNSNSGQMVRRFEERWAERCEREHAICCSSGSFAVQAAIAALELQPGDEVITTTVTDFGALAAVVYEGLVPRFCDVDPDTLMPTAATIEEAWTEKVRAVVLTHLFGQAARMEEVSRLCCARGVSLIEDAAQATESFDRGTRAGTVGRLSCWSFQQGKHMSCGEGGAVTCAEPELARRVRLFVNKAWPYGEPDPDHMFFAPNGRMTELQAAVLHGQLDKLDTMIAARRASADAFLAELVGLRGVAAPELEAGDQHSYWRLGLWVDPASVEGGATALGAALRELGISCAPHYVGRPAFELLAFQKRLSFGGSGFPWRRPGEPELPLEDRKDFPGTVQGLERVLVLPWNERISPELGAELGRAVREAAEELAR
ncbi:MAG: aminotransferase DegT [Planctomycetota bacterium]|nr:MAG: aminotransferase DegT [Planctomycetota bacterium]